MSREEERVLSKEVIVDAPVEQVWDMWTSEPGLASWATEHSRIDLNPGGEYAWFLDLDADDRGVRGSDGSTIVSVDPPRELVFDWTFPPVVTPTLRASGATTRITLELADEGAGATRVDLTARGWEEGEEWDLGFEYFDNAWGGLLELLRARV